LKALVPKGYFIDRFPTESTTASEIQAREVEASRKVLQDQVAALEAQAQSLINKRMNFFAPHFGLKPQKGIADTYLLDEQGRWKGVTTGAAANSIANEIMLYKNPAPSSVNLTQVETVGLIMNMIKRYELTNQINSMGVQRTVEDIKEFYSLKRRPTYEEFKATDEAMKSFISYDAAECILYDQWADEYAPSNYNEKHTTFPEGAFAYSRTAKHPSGFTIIPINILRFYRDAYKVGKPEYFWRYCSQYRLGLFKPTGNELATKIGVAIYPVDPFTGAPKRTVESGDVVATGEPGSESSLLATVKGALFPEVYTLEAGVNYQVGDAKVRYRNELAAALNMWNGVADKLNTPLVTIASQSEDGAVTNLSVYLQPTGIEQAMAKLVKGEPFQAWFDGVLGDKAFAANDLPKKMITTQISDTDWQAYRLRFDWTVMAMAKAMSHPATYIGGIHHLATTFATHSGGTQDATNLLDAVGWPAGKPTKLFEVYVDDTRDANIVINALFTYLQEESLMKPPEMYFPEPIQASLSYAQYVAPKDPNVQSTDQAPEAGKTYNYEISKSSPISLSNYTHPQGLLRPDKVEKFRGSVWPSGQLPVIRRYYSSGKTVVSKRTITGAGSGFLKEATQLREVENRITPMSVQMGSMAQEEVNIIIGVGALALIGGILLFKR
jgi:hypothetical protein